MAISTSLRKPYQAPRCGDYSLSSSQDLLVAGSQTGRGLESDEYDEDNLPSQDLGGWELIKYPNNECVARPLGGECLVLCAPEKARRAV